MNRFTMGRPKTVRLMLSDRCLSLSVCLSVCLSVPLVYCGQTVGWIKIKIGMEAGLGPGQLVLDGDPALPKKEHTRHVLTHVCCCQTAVWFNVQLGMDVCLGPGDIV